MNTIFAYFSNRILTAEEQRKTKLYCFNTSDKVDVGDAILSPNYTTTFIVATILETSYKYYNSVTGDLSNELTSTGQREIATLVLRNEDSSVVYGTIV